MMVNNLSGTSTQSYNSTRSSRTFQCTLQCTSCFRLYVQMDLCLPEFPSDMKRTVAETRWTRTTIESQSELQVIVMEMY